MAPLETWLIKVKSAIHNNLPLPRPRLSSKKPRTVGVLSFEIAGLMSKLIHLWQSLSDKNVIRLKNDSISLEGVRKIVSNDETFLLGLACAELTDQLRQLAGSVARIGRRCSDSNLREFGIRFDRFANSGYDPHGWAVGWKEAEGKVNKKMDRYVTATAVLRKEIEELTALETALRKAVGSQSGSCNKGDETASLSLSKEQRIADLKQKVFWQRQEVRSLKEKSLWNRSFDGVVSMLARSSFTVLARIKLVFGLGNGSPTCLPRSLSASAAVYPSSANSSEEGKEANFVSGPLAKSVKLNDPAGEGGREGGFFETNSKILNPPATTLGAAALALHYANLIIVMEKMIKSPQLVGVDARDDLYAMLPSSVRCSLRRRLRGVGFTATDPGLAGEWKDALGRVLNWLSPLAHNMIKWQSERSFEQGNSSATAAAATKTNVMLLQTLYFANRDKAEAAITELLVGLNYIWRYEREMTAKALFECANFGGLLMKSSAAGKEVFC